MKILGLIMGLIVAILLIAAFRWHVINSAKRPPHFRDFVFVSVADEDDLTKMPITLQLVQSNALADPSIALPYFSSTAIYRSWVFDTQRMFNVSAMGYATQKLVVARPGSIVTFLKRTSD